MMHLKKVVNDHGQFGPKFLEYVVENSTPGAGGTSLSANLVLEVGSRYSCRIFVDQCDGPNVNDTLSRMSSWLRRLADGIDQRETLEIPI